MQIPRWRNLLVLQNSLVSTFSASKTTTTAINSQVASFHSTPPACQKWKNKWKSDIKRTQQPSKNYIRYVTRQKRADTKRALNDLLYHGGLSNTHKAEDPIRNKWEEGWDIDGSGGSDKKQQSKFSAQRVGKSHHKKMKRKFRRQSFSEDDNNPETIFQATFGNKWYTWSFPGDSFSKSSASGFEWRENSDWSNCRKRGWASSSESESEEVEFDAIGTFSDRTILGLPPTGPLKIEDVKNAFRLSALKWHPDKHQGPSQAMAEEKFKLCVNAYKSLCAALS
ncbi:hypothetical protein SLE2022_365760 [Rubroshorea leprosula]